MIGTKKMKKVLGKDGQNNFSLAIYSVIIAVFTWFVISMSLYPSAKTTVTDVPLEINLSGTSTNDQGLSIISCNVSTVKVKLMASRTQIRNIDSSTLVAYVDTDSVSTVGQRSLPIKVKSTNGTDFELEGVSPASAVIVFDKLETKQFPINPKVPNITYEKDKTVDSSEFTCDPDYIEVTGPSAQLAKISSVYAVSDRDMKLDSSFALKSDRVQLLMDDGTELDTESFKFNTTNFMINIPVLTQKTVGLTVKIVGAPDNFDTSSIKFDLSADSITLATKNSQGSIPDELDIAKILLSDIRPDYSKTFDITSVLETQNCINLSDVQNVTVSVDGEGLAVKTLVIDNSRMTISNLPSDNADYSIITPSLTIDVVGPADVVNEVTANDIIADVNLLNASISEDQFTYDMTFSCPKYKNIWAASNWKVSIQRTERSTEAPTAATSN